MKLLNRFSLLMVVLGLLVFTVIPASAQDLIAYGDVLGGEVEEEEEVEYTFEGAEGDIIVAHLWGTSLDDNLTAPIIELRDAGGDTIATSAYTFREATVTATLEEDGEYVIAVIADTGNEGEYNLALYQPEVLESGATVEGSLDADSEDQYYYVSGEDDVTVTFSFEDAQEFVPTFRVYNAEDFALVGYVVSVIEDATGSFNLPGGEQGYIISVEYTTSDLLIYEETSSDFAITVE